MTEHVNPDRSDRDVERALASFGAPAMAYRTFGVMATGVMQAQTPMPMPGGTPRAGGGPAALAAPVEVDPLLVDLVRRALSGERPAQKQTLIEIPDYAPAPIAPSAPASWLAKILAAEPLAADSDGAEASWLSDAISSPPDAGDARQMANLEA